MWLLACVMQEVKAAEMKGTQNMDVMLTAPLSAGEGSVQQTNITANVETFFHLYKSMFEIQRDSSLTKLPLFLSDQNRLSFECYYLNAPLQAVHAVHEMGTGCTR